MDPDEIQTLDGSLFGEGQPCFGCGPEHPFGFRLRCERLPDGDGVTSRLTPDERYQGPPGIMHGGLVMALADELGAWAVIAKHGCFGFTADFRGRLHHPVRIGHEAEGTARVLDSNGRIVRVGVRIEQGEHLAYSGELRFVMVDRRGAERVLGAELPPGWERFAL
ncbi:MAG: PaaI family thioesterase [Myxococcales bacterium]|nr:PaaI family thioesterase [Myxococcales bacterium]